MVHQFVLQALMKWACHLNWQILTVVAACCPDAPLLSCLVAWLDIFAQSDSHALNAEADPEDSISIVDKLAWHVHNFCKQGRFGDVLEAFLIFPVLPGKIASHFLNGLSMFVQHMIPSAELHFKSFHEALAKSDAPGKDMFFQSTGCKEGAILLFVTLFTLNSGAVYVPIPVSH